MILIGQCSCSFLLFSIIVFNLWKDFFNKFFLFFVQISIFCYIFLLVLFQVLTEWNVGLFPTTEIPSFFKTASLQNFSSCCFLFKVWFVIVAAERQFESQPFWWIINMNEGIMDWIEIRHFFLYWLFTFFVRNFELMGKIFKILSLKDLCYRTSRLVITIHSYQPFICCRLMVSKWRSALMTASFPAALLTFDFFARSANVLSFIFVVGSLNLTFGGSDSSLSLLNVLRAFSPEARACIKSRA